MAKLLCLLAFILISQSAFSADPWNVYQFNKREHKLWYEWWYYKIVLPETNDSFFFVYGIVNPADSQHGYKGTRSYVQAGDFSQKIQVEEKFPINEFRASELQTYVEVSSNVATDKFFKGSITDKKGNPISWNIKIENRWAFNAEGWLMGRLITDIEWYPAAADARCSGTIVSNNKLHSFTDVPCYQDRNWGKTFPDWWAWIVSNHFEKSPGTALAIGGGKPHIYGERTPFHGVAIGLKHQGIVYDFRPNDLNYIKTDITFGRWKIRAMDRHYLIEIEASALTTNLWICSLQLPPESFSMIMRHSRVFSM
ncbi:MAG: tocopherol cyclase family protein [Bacteriovoracaceae bacterium]